MIYITGDIHGDPSRFSSHSFDCNYMTKDDIVIIAGDFGLIWNYKGEDDREKYWLDWLEKKPFTTVFVDGNHECFERLYQYPAKKWNGGKVHEIRPSIFHLMRGEIYHIDGKTLFAFGGASSHDVKDGIFDPNDYSSFQDFKDFIKNFNRKNPYALYRIKNMSWWEQELPTQEEMENGLKNLEKVNWKVDYVVTHTPPSSIINLIGKGLYKPDYLTDYLEEIRSKLEYDKWCCGHMHINKYINSKDILLYEDIKCLSYEPSFQFDFLEQEDIL